MLNYDSSDAPTDKAKIKGFSIMKDNQDNISSTVAYQIGGLVESVWKGGSAERIVLTGTDSDGFINAVVACTTIQEIFQLLETTVVANDPKASSS